MTKERYGRMTGKARSASKLRRAPFALRIVDRAAGRCALVLRRGPDSRGRDRLGRLAAVSPLAFNAGVSLLQEAVKASNGLQGRVELSPGPSLPLTEDWGARVACYAIISAGLRDAGRLGDASEKLRLADGTEAAWWLGLLTGSAGSRAARALRILTGAVA